MPNYKENLKKNMDITNVDRSENNVEIIPSDQSISTPLSFLEINNIPAEIQDRRTDSNFGSKMFFQLEIKDFYQYDIERKKLDLEDKKSDCEHKKNNYNRIERVFYFSVVIVLTAFLLILPCAFFLLLIYLGKDGLMTDFIKSNPFQSVTSVIVHLLSSVGTGIWINRKIGKLSKNEE